jgi:hypothetical protein
MPNISARLQNVIDAYISETGETARLTLAIGDQGSIDLELSPDAILALRTAVEYVGQQSEARRDAAASRGHLSPHPFLPIQRTQTLQVFVPDRIGVRVFLHNSCPLDFVLTQDGARALRNQLDASIAEASRPARPAH